MIIPCNHIGCEDDDALLQWLIHLVVYCDADSFKFELLKCAHCTYNNDKVVRSSFQQQRLLVRKYGDFHYREYFRYKQQHLHTTDKSQSFIW